MYKKKDRKNDRKKSRKGKLGLNMSIEMSKRENETIAAIATGMTDSGIGIIRISGPEAVNIGNKVFRLPSGREYIKNGKSHVLQYGYAVDIRDGEDEGKYSVIDEVMATVMYSPRSYTGEDTVEIQCHGGVFVMKKILDTVLRCGARLAEPGEFTKKAFMNGRIDLSRAEAVMDVIQSQNEAALSSSVSQLKGMLYEKVKNLRSDIIYEIAFIEAALDDPEHMSLDGYPERLLSKTEMLQGDIEKLIRTADDGKLIKEGINTVIIGKPNVGKSSLLNRLLGEERAIVTDIAGTTRDILTENIRLGEISLNIMDTAGIRSTDDTVEKIGVEKTRKYAEKADLILYMVDASAELDENDREIIELTRDKKRIIILNKSDLESKVTEEEISKLDKAENRNMENQYLQNSRLCIIRTSMKNGSGMEELERTVKNMFFNSEIGSSNEIIITNIRHKVNLQEAYESLSLVKKSIEEGMPEDFYSIDLMNAYSSLGRIIGEEVDDDLVEEIFSKFCMGK